MKSRLPFAIRRLCSKQFSGQFVGVFKKKGGGGDKLMKILTMTTGMRVSSWCDN